MLKNFGLQVAKAGMDHAAFMRHWRTVHAPLSAGVDGVRGYVLNEILERCPQQGVAAMSVAPSVDGIAQLWFDSQAAMGVVAQTPEAKRWFSDGANYLGGRTGIATSEQALKAPALGAARPRDKLIRLVARDATLTAAGFAEHWRRTVQAALSTATGVQAAVQSLVTAISPATNMPAVQLEPVDGIDEFWCESPAAARQLAAQLPAAGIRASCCWLVQETVVIAPPQL